MAVFIKLFSRIFTKTPRGTVPADLHKISVECQIMQLNLELTELKMKTPRKKDLNVNKLRDYIADGFTRVTDRECREVLADIVVKAFCLEASGGCRKTILEILVNNKWRDYNHILALFIKVDEYALPQPQGFVGSMGRVADANMHFIRDEFYEGFRTLGRPIPEGRDPRIWFFCVDSYENASQVRACLENYILIVRE